MRPKKRLPHLAPCCFVTVLYPAIAHADFCNKLCKSKQDTSSCVPLCMVYVIQCLLKVILDKQVTNMTSSQ